MSNKRPILPQAPEASSEGYTPQTSSEGFESRFRINIVKDIAELRSKQQQMFQGRKGGRYSRAAAPDPSERYQRGDIVYNSAPAETGGAGSMYVLVGWICVAEAPQTWVEMRTLTGA